MLVPTNFWTGNTERVNSRTCAFAFLVSYCHQSFYTPLIFRPPIGNAQPRVLSDVGAQWFWRASMLKDGGWKEGNEWNNFICDTKVCSFVLKILWFCGFASHLLGTCCMCKCSHEDPWICIWISMNLHIWEEDLRFSGWGCRLWTLILVRESRCWQEGLDGCGWWDPGWGRINHSNGFCMFLDQLRLGRKKLKVI